MTGQQDTPSRRASRSSPGGRGAGWLALLLVLAGLSVQHLSHNDTGTAAARPAHSAAVLVALSTGDVPHDRQRGAETWAVCRQAAAAPTRRAGAPIGEAGDAAAANTAACPPSSRAPPAG